MHAIDRQPLVYPDSDGQPMAENTLQFQWIVTIKENLDARRPDFVAGDLLWYPVEGEPKIRQAPDVMVAVGRPKGHRGSYMQWREDGVPPQVVFEILSPGNRVKDSIRKFNFYERYGVEELYVYDPDRETLDGWIRKGDRLIEVDEMKGFISPHLAIRFEHTDTLRLYDTSGERFTTFAELKGQAEAERARADREAARADEQAARAAALEARLRELGIEP